MENHMWYLGFGSGVDLTSSESVLLEELGYYLSKSGWKLRSGGLGLVDDAIIQGARNYTNSFSPSLPCTNEVIIPFSQYRGYDADGENIYAYSKLPEDIQNKALGIGERHSRKTKLKSRFQRQMLGCGASIVNGLDLDTPVRFAITLFRGDVVDRGSAYNGSLFSYESNIYRLLSAYKIPLFNVANEQHRERIAKFININKKTESASPLPGKSLFKKAI